ncbi:Holliday junction ATP-dependent DNA helicase RuvA [Bifidobacterium sp. DSM 109958]|uniref:Holliday junction branch migration complex subunit RuvA n=1 Tax=Bifidobacterium moraviense TaxID=2675323 RepID=A0A7Y0F0F8_9BIFI|nr:Holliday junction branch migration protein RuvA [Bifidobacterium sp. DSM 109958]NMM99755.1 Holliday junction ATP-dependent DNA helicase RuvA [Bifidobacterium sp. DSM 109958]
MIGMLNGVVMDVGADVAVIDVGGIGFEARMTSTDLASMHSGQQVRVHTSLSVSQDALTLYAFLSRTSRTLFAQLQKVSGIGPKVALSLLSTLTPKQLAQAVADGDSAALSRAPGLGRKGAQKIILELAGTINMDEVAAGRSAARAQDPALLQCVQGLVSLGWQQRDAESAVAGVCEEEGIATPLGEDDVPRVLRLALASLDRGR